LRRCGRRRFNISVFWYSRLELTEKAVSCSLHLFALFRDRCDDVGGDRFHVKRLELQTTTP
jgi:hypothetical protein